MTELNTLLEYLNFCGVPLLKDNKSSIPMTLVERVEWHAQNYAKCQDHVAATMQSREQSITPVSPVRLRANELALHDQGLSIVGTCVDCGRPQFDTPSGSVCANGHGGADSVEDRMQTTELLAESLVRKESSDKVRQAFGPPKSDIKLRKGQTKAWKKLEAWLKRQDPYFVLRGFAGTGKTYLMQMLRQLGTHTFYYSAPTNKATKVLGTVLGVQTKTIYSLLGLRMVHDEDGLTLQYPDPDKLPYFKRGSIIVIDEASMLSKQLIKFIEEIRERYDLRIIYVGDPLQLPPIGEKRSRAWKVTDDTDCRALLTEVVRYDDQLLKLATRVRENIKNEVWESPAEDDHDDEKGVWVLSRKRFESSLLKNIEPNTFIERKVVAWRNKTVNRYNQMIRTELGFSDPYCVGDRLLIGSPIERFDEIIAHTDEEGVVMSVVDDCITVEETNIEIHAINLQLEDRTLLLHVAKDKHEHRLSSLLSKKAAKARRSSGKTRSKLWADFWNIKNRFHEVRYAYAITAHRIQGSTHTEVFVDQADVLANPNKLEAMCCLYVAFTRPTTKLFTF